MTNPPAIPENSAPPRNTLVSLIALQFVFALTGVGLALLGPILPSLSARLSLDDAHAGLIFTVFYTSSSLGALLVRGNFTHALAAGLAVTALGAAGLVNATPHSVLPLFLVFGLGLGIAMTAVSLFASRNYARRRAAALVLLNFSWSGGAAIAPLFVASRLTLHQPQSVFTILAFAAAAGACLMLVLLRDYGSRITKHSVHLRTRPPWGTIAFFATIALLENGTEATIGGWLSTYAQRLGLAGTAHAAASASFFWIAFLIGRGVVSLLLLRVEERLVFVVSMIIALCGITAILLASTPAALAAGAIIIGLGLAAIFPINLSLFFARMTDPAHAGWVLAICGFGGSILPALTGFLSARTGSLHTGLFVPAVAIAVMLTMVLAAICNRHGYLSLLSS